MNKKFTNEEIELIRQAVTGELLGLKFGLHPQDMETCEIISKKIDAYEKIVQKLNEKEFTHD